MNFELNNKNLHVKYVKETKIEFEINLPIEKVEFKIGKPFFPTNSSTMCLYIVDIKSNKTILKQSEDKNWKKSDFITILNFHRECKKKG